MTTEPKIKDGTPLGKKVDWGFHNSPELAIRQALFYERSGFQRFPPLVEIAAIDTHEWEDANTALSLLAYFRWLAKPTDE